MKASVFIATSLDGFIAREDGALDWLPGVGSPLPAEDHGYDAFIATIDVLIMGRHTFEQVLTFGAWPYGSRKVIVLATRPVTVPSQQAEMVEVMQAAPSEVVSRLAARGYQHAYVDGGRTIQRFLAAGLIQRLVITQVPVLLGRGRPLFGLLPHDQPLRHVATRAFPSGLVQSEYEVAA